MFPAQVPSTGGRRRKEQSYRSVISDVFNGSVLSLVQCLTCDRVGAQGSWHCLPCGAGWTLPWHSYPRSKLSASPAGAVDTGKGGHQAGLHPIGIDHSGDIPGPVIAHPWQGRPSQTPLCHLPECTNQARCLWGQLLLPELAGLHRRVHPKVCWDFSPA